MRMRMGYALLREREHSIDILQFNMRERRNAKVKDTVQYKD